MSRAFLAFLFAAGVAALPATFPKLIDLPSDTLPEGIAAGRGTTLYAGSRLDGRIFKIDARIGLVEQLVAPLPGTPELPTSERYDTRPHPTSRFSSPS
jgi:hypothetical protein